MSYRILTAFLLLTIPAAARADDWPQWLGPQRDGVWRETGVLDKFPEGGPKVLWRAPVKVGYAGPAVAEGKVYLMDFESEKAIPKDSFNRGELPGNERVLCLDAASGKPVWEHKYPVRYTISYPNGPRCTPTVQGGKVYTLGAEGNLHCLDAATGAVAWSKDFKKDYGAKTPMWGFCGHPLVDGQKLVCVVGGEGSLAVAFDKDTGKEIWRSLTAPEQGYSPPTLIEAGGTRQLLIWHGKALNSLDPETGKPYWSVPLEPAFGMSIMTPRQEGEYLFAGGISQAPGRGVALALKLAADRPAAEEVWRVTTKDKDRGVFPVNSTPFLADGMIYAIDQPGQLRGVKLATGERVWATFVPVTGKEQDENFRGTGAGTAFIVKNGDRYFLFNEKGELIIARLTPQGYQEVGRAKILEPTSVAFGRDVVWSHPAFANKCLFARNDKELVCVSLAAAPGGE
jgi:outer membrane protein assembly factor BamB